MLEKISQLDISGPYDDRNSHYFLYDISTFSQYY